MFIQRSTTPNITRRAKFPCFKLRSSSFLAPSPSCLSYSHNARSPVFEEEGTCTTPSLERPITDGVTSILNYYRDHNGVLGLGIYALDPLYDSRVSISSKK
jgi:hypothetical protein